MSLVKSLYLYQFRKLAGETFDFDKGINAIIGPNAQGKTTLLEAIYFLVTGRSFRTPRLTELIQTDADLFHIAALIEKKGVEQRLNVTVKEKERRVEFNSTVFSSLSSLFGLLLGSVITPDDTFLIKGSPQARRDFLDVNISEVDPLYTYHLSRYHRAMRQRNACLKMKELKTCESWEHEMSLSAAYVTSARKMALDDIAPLFQEKYAMIGETDEKVGLNFSGPQESDLQSCYLKHYHRLRHRELLAGYTMTGPHKDDVGITLNGQEAKFYASEGQKQTIVAALKLAEWQRLYKKSEEKPIFLIDDIGLGMDSRRRGRFYREIESMGQVFVTSTERPPLKDMNLISLGSL